MESELHADKIFGDSERRRGARIQESLATRGEDWAIKGIFNTFCDSARNCEVYPRANGGWRGCLVKQCRKLNLLSH